MCDSLVCTSRKFKLVSDVLVALWPPSSVKDSSLEYIYLKCVLKVRVEWMNEVQRTSSFTLHSFFFRCVSGDVWACWRGGRWIRFGWADSGQGWAGNGAFYERSGCQQRRPSWQSEVAVAMDLLIYLIYMMIADTVMSRHEPFHALIVVRTQSVPHLCHPSALFLCPPHYIMPILLKSPHLSFLSAFPPLLPFHSSSISPSFTLSPSSPLLSLTLRRNLSQWLCVGDEPVQQQRPTKYLSSLTRTRCVVHVC